MVNGLIRTVHAHIELVTAGALVLSALIAFFALPWVGLILAAAAGCVAARSAMVYRTHEAELTEEIQALTSRLSYAESRGVHEDWETGLGNRRHLDISWTRQWARYRRRREPFALAMFEVIDASRPNKALRPIVLGLTVQVLRGVTRAEDTVCRLEGRVFAVMLATTGAEGVESLTRRVHSRLEGTHQTEAGEVSILLRSGAGVCTDRTGSLDDLLLAASFDLHEAPPKTLADAWAA